MPVWLAIALKDLRLLTRDPMALFWVFGFPVVFAGFFGSIMRAGVDAQTAPLSVVVVAEGEAGGSRARSLATSLSGAGLDVQTADPAAAREAVRRGEAVAFVAPTPERGGAVTVGIDPSRRAESAMLKGMVMRALSPEFMPMTVRPPQIALHSVLPAEVGPQSGYEIVFPAMILWGLLGCAATFAVAIVSERVSGAMLRLRAAPISRATILAGKAAACALSSLVTASLLGVAGWALLDVRIGDPLKLAAALLATTACFAGLTMVLSVLGKSEQAVAGAGWSTLIVLAMVGGAMVPLSLMPDWLLAVSDLSPVKWGIVALEGATWRGDAWHDLWPSLLALAGLGAAGLSVGATVLANSES